MMPLQLLFSLSIGCQHQFFMDTLPWRYFFRTKPDCSFLKVFGCQCFSYLRPYNSHKMQFCSIPCAFVIYSHKHKGYNCLDLSGRIYISRHVTFDENMFPFASTIVPEYSTVSNHVNTSSWLPLLTSVHHTIHPNTLHTKSNHVSPCSLKELDSSTTQKTQTSPRTSNNFTSIQLELLETQQPTIAPSGNSPPMRTRSKTRIYKPRVLLTIDLSTVEPTTVHEVFQSPLWKVVMQEEYDVLIANGTWSPVS